MFLRECAIDTTIDTMTSRRRTEESQRQVEVDFTTVVTSFVVFPTEKEFVIEISQRCCVLTIFTSRIDSFHADCV